MLFLIGGAARSGKTLLARRLLQVRRVPYFSTDYLTSGLSAGAPDLRIGHELPNPVRGEEIWPILRGVLQNLVEVEPEYAVEGDVLVPDKVADFARRNAGSVRACFLGYARCASALEQAERYLLGGAAA